MIPIHTLSTLLGRVAPLILALLCGACGASATQATAGHANPSANEGVLRRGRVSYTCRGPQAGQLIAQADGRLFVDGDEVARIGSDGAVVLNEGDAVATLSADGTVRLSNVDATAHLATDEDALTMPQRPTIYVREDGRVVGLGPSEAECALEAAPEHRRYFLYALLIAMWAPESAPDAMHAPDPVEPIVESATP